MNNNIMNNIENTTGIARQKNMDWFKADRSLSTQVADFMRCFVWRAEINAKFKAEQEKIDNSLETLAGMKKGTKLAVDIDGMEKVYLARKAELETQRKEQIDKEATFVLTTADTNLKRNLSNWASGKKDAMTPEAAIAAWFVRYGLTPSDRIIDEILAGAGEKLKVKTLVKTEGRIATSFDSTNCFKMVFAKCYEHMVEVGTIKATQIPPIVAEKYAPKKKSSKKGGKKA